MMDDIADQQELAAEITNAISNPLNTDPILDDDELEAELESLEQDALEKELLAINTHNIIDTESHFDGPPSDHHSDDEPKIENPGPSKKLGKQACKNPQNFKIIQTKIP